MKWYEREKFNEAKNAFVFLILVEKKNDTCWEYSHISICNRIRLFIKFFQLQVFDNKS